MVINPATGRVEITVEEGWTLCPDYNVTLRQAVIYFNTFVDRGAFGSQNPVNVHAETDEHGSRTVATNMLAACLYFGLPLVGKRGKGNGTFIAVTQAELDDYARVRRMMAEKHLDVANWTDKIKPWPVPTREAA